MAPRSKIDAGILLDSEGSPKQQIPRARVLAYRVGCSSALRREDHRVIVTVKIGHDSSFEFLAGCRPLSRERELPGQYPVPVAGLSPESS
jgi:hypothetical protein